MRSLRRRAAFLLAAGLAFSLWPALLLAQVELTLRRSFIERIKNRVTITASFVVDTAHRNPNTAKKDADLHIAGRSADIELATVAEIMNAAKDQFALQQIRTADATGAPVRMMGVWRIWAEHGGEVRHRQGNALQPFRTTNPDHVFEIHPVLEIDGHGLQFTLTPIDGFETKDAAMSFERYEAKAFQIRALSGGMVQMTTSGLGFNYVRFKIVLLETPFQVEDGAFVQADVLDLEDEILVRKRRMVFAAGTPPAVRLAASQVGDTLEVLGVPRVDLALVSWRLSQSATRPEVLTWTIPYEMIIAGVYPQ